jgi:proline dehydrogenase
MIITMMPLIPKSIIKMVAMKYIAGDTLEDAKRVTNEFAKLGGMTTIDVLGEFVTTKEEAVAEKEESIRVLKAIKENNMPTYLSVKPTSQGLEIDEEFAYQNIKEIISLADEYGIFVRLDMENSPFTDGILNLYRRYRADGFDNVGIVLQSYMRRSENDIKSLISLKPSIRLCKGIYKESPEIAFQGKEEIRNNYKKLLRMILDNGMYVGVATHDDVLLDDAMNEIAKRGLQKDNYEIQMLLGVREKRRDAILKMGHPVRIYVPYGSDWYGYATRRLKENPDMAGHIFKAMFSKK